MQPTMFPLMIINILENHATREHPMTIREITDKINVEFAPFAMDKEKMINRTTVMRILDTMELWMNGNLFNAKLIQCGTDTKKMFCLEK